MHSVPVLGVFSQKAQHRHLGFIRKLHVKMAVNQPDHRHGISNKVCIQHIEKAPLRVAVTLAELDGKARTPLPVPRYLDTKLFPVQTSVKDPRNTSVKLAQDGNTLSGSRWVKTILASG